jgi:tRNA(adenine34) deaminase
MSKKPRKTRKWSHNVTSVSTFPPEGIFTKDAETIARVMATREVSPKGVGSGIRMVQFFINRAGKNLSPDRKAELEKAKEIMREKLRNERTTSRATSATV